MKTILSFSNPGAAKPVLLLLVAWLLAACTPESHSPLRIASSPWPGYEPLYLARELGYLPQDKASVFELTSSDITLESFRNHSADMATLTLDESLDLMQSGIKFRVVLVLDESHGADAVMATPKVKSLADLKGKRVVIENLPLGVYMLSRTLDAAHLKRSDVRVILSAESKHEDMYRQDKADAFITFEPFKSKLAALGARVVFDSSQIPNEIFDLMLVHEDVYQQRREEVCNVARQWFRTMAYIKSSPEEAARIIGKRLGVSPADYRSMVAGIRQPGRDENLALLAGEAPGILGSSRRLNEIMIREGQMKHEVTFAQALDPQLLACYGR